MSVRQQQQQQGAQSKSIGNYILGRTIGEGTFGKVKLGRHILSGANVAVKVLQKDRIVEVADVERVAREVHILKLIRHPHIVQLFEIIETRGQLYLIMEYASGGELFDYIVAKGRVQEQEACRFFHQIIAGVEKIHESHVVHRDLKPENLLLDEHKCIKIVDFGLSNLFRDGQRLSTACGSPCYAPPEMVAGQQYVPQMCDLWSCGVILFAMVCGYLPFEDQNTAALYKKILAADYTLPNFISDAVKDLIGGLLTADPARRFTIQNVRAHPWYRQVAEASVPPVREGSTLILDEDVLHELEAYGFPRDYAVRCLELNKHNHITTTYYLLHERKRRVLEQLDVDGSMRATGSSSKVPASELQQQQQQQQQPPGSARNGQHQQHQSQQAPDGAHTPVPSGHGQASDLNSTGGRTPRPGQVSGNYTPRESSQTPRCETGRNSAAARRVSAAVAGGPRPNTSPNRREQMNTRGGKSNTIGPDGVSVAGATVTTPRTHSPWRSQTPNHTTPHAYSARGRSTGGASGNSVSGHDGGAGVPSASTPGAGSPWRPGVVGNSQQGAAYSARGKSPINGSSPGGADGAGASARASSPWRAGAGAGGAPGGNPPNSARGKNAHGASGNSVSGVDSTGGAAGSAGGGGAGGAPGAGSPWRNVTGAQSTTPQVTPRVCTTPRTTAFTPRGQAVTPRAGTPQGTTVYRHPHSQPPQGAQSAQGQASAALPAGSMSARGAVMSSRRRPPTSQGIAAPSNTAVAPVRGAVTTPTSRMIWR